MRRQDKKKLPEELKKQAKKIGEKEFLEYAKSREFDVAKLTERQARILLNDLRRGVKFKDVYSKAKYNDVRRTQEKKKLIETSKNGEINNDNSNKKSGLKMRNIFRLNYKSLIMGIFIGIITGYFVSSFFSDRYRITSAGYNSREIIKIDKWTGKTWKLTKNDNGYEYWKVVDHKVVANKPKYENSRERLRQQLRDGL